MNTRDGPIHVNTSATAGRTAAVHVSIPHMLAVHAHVEREMSVRQFASPCHDAMPAASMRSASIIVVAWPVDRGDE